MHAHLGKRLAKKASKFHGLIVFSDTSGFNSSPQDDYAQLIEKKKLVYVIFSLCIVLCNVSEIIVGFKIVCLFFFVNRAVF